MNPKRRKWPITRHTRGMRSLRWRARARMLMQLMMHEPTPWREKEERMHLFLGGSKGSKCLNLSWYARLLKVAGGKEWRLK